MNWFNFKKEKRSTEVTNTSVSSGSILGFTGLGSAGALNISTFYQGLNLIMGSIGQLPCFVKKIDSKGNTNILKKHVCNLLFNDKNAVLSMGDMLKQITKDVILKGNGYIYIHRAMDGTPVKLQYIEASDVTVYWNKERQELYYQSYVIKHRIMPSDMLHFKLYTNDGVNGISVLRFAKQSIDLANAAEQQASEFFQNGMNKTSGYIKVSSPLNEKQRQQILSTWQSTYTSSKAGITVLPGNMDYNSIQINPDEAELLESREFNQAMVCHFLNINPAILGIKGYTSYKSFEDENNHILQRTIMPYINMIENEMSRKLLNENESNLKIILDTVRFLRSDKQAQSSYYQTMVGAGILSINEARKELGYGAVEGGDVNIIPYSDTAQNSIQGNKNNQDNKNNGEGTEKPNK